MKLDELPSQVRKKKIFEYNLRYGTLLYCTVMYIRTVRNLEKELPVYSFRYGTVPKRKLLPCEC